QILVQPVARTLAAQARLLDTAEGRDLVREDAAVHADHARFDRLRDPEDPADVAGVEVGSEPELGGIRHLYRLLLGPEAKERRHRTERLLPGDPHLLGHVHEDRRLEEQPAARM